MPGETYAFDYVAAEDATLMTMEYQAADDVVEAVRSTRASDGGGAWPSRSGCWMPWLPQRKRRRSFRKEIKYNYNDYQFLCVKLQAAPAQFAFVEGMTVYEPSGLGLGWEAEVCRSVCGREEALRENFYPLEVSFCVATVMRASEAGRRVRQKIGGRDDVYRPDTGGISALRRGVL